MTHRTHITLKLCIIIATFSFLTSCNQSPKTDVNIWNGHHLCSNFNDSITIPCELFDSLRTGDEIVVEFKYINEECPTFGILDGKRNEFVGTSRLYTTDRNLDNFSFFVSPSMADSIRHSGLTIYGKSFELTTLGIRHNNTPIDYDNIIWYGKVSMTDDNQTQHEFTAKTFIKAQDGDVMCLAVDNIGDSAAIVMTTAGRQSNIICKQNITNDSIISIVLDHKILESLRREGLKINGRRFTSRQLVFKHPEWQGRAILNWDNGDYQMTPPETYKDAKLGDQIKICFTYTGESEWPQMAFIDNQWNDLPGTGRTLIENDMNSISFYVTQQMLERIQKEGMLITGIGFMLKSVYIQKGEATPLMDGARWIGHVDMDPEWKNVQRICAATFNDVEVGDVMRLHVSNIKNGSMISLRPGNWEKFDNLEPFTLDINDTYFDYVLDDYMLNIIKEEGCVVFGTGFTFNAMHIIKK